MDEIFWGVASDAVEQSRHKADMVSRETGNLAFEANHPRIPPNQKKMSSQLCGTLDELGSTGQRFNNKNKQN